MKDFKFLAFAAAVALTVASTSMAHAQSTMDPSKTDSMKTTPAPAAVGMTEGEVRKIDLEGSKVTLKHAEIKNLDMPGMTMVFVVKDKAMLDKLKAGDKVQFKAINDAGKMTVTEIQPVR